MKWIALCAAGCAGGLVRGEDTGSTPTAPVGPGDVIPPEGAPLVGAYLGGAFSTLPAFDGVASVYGAAQLVRYLDGTAGLTLSVTGLTPATEHTAHVHTWPCEYEAGGHYLIDPAVLDGGEPNEVWASFTPDVDGNAAYEKSVDVGLRGDALSVVVHDPVTGDKLACADLLPEQTVGSTAEGTVSPFAYYEVIDETIAGSAKVTMSTSTTVDLSLSGLTPTETYAAHVHVLPCDVTNAGGHYKLDPTVVETLPTNEIWPEIAVGADGSATASIRVASHALREDAASVVVHRTSAPDAPKVACADLTRTGYLPSVTYGPFTALPGAPATPAGTGKLERRWDGATIATAELSGLTPGGAYPVHVHALPCGVADGGGHYLIDPATPDAGEANELWVELVADATGVAKRSVGITHLARAEAQSMVVHSADGTRLACADLE
ncbi:MAG: hypothetical protein ABMA64_35420 [Myxococcota bacterium]